MIPVGVLDHGRLAPGAVHQVRHRVQRPLQRQSLPSSVILRGQDGSKNLRVRRRPAPGLRAHDRTHRPVSHQHGRLRGDALRAEPVVAPRLTEPDEIGAEDVVLETHPASVRANREPSLFFHRVVTQQTKERLLRVPRGAHPAERRRSRLALGSAAWAPRASAHRRLHPSRLSAPPGAKHSSTDDSASHPAISNTAGAPGVHIAAIVSHAASVASGGSHDAVSASSGGDARMGNPAGRWRAARRADG